MSKGLRGSEGWWAIGVTGGASDFWRGSTQTKHMRKEKKERKIRNTEWWWSIKNFVRNGAEATGREKGIGPFHLIKKAFRSVSGYIHFFFCEHCEKHIVPSEDGCLHPPSSTGMYRASVSAASVCLMFLTEFILTSTPPLQGVGTSILGWKWGNNSKTELWKKPTHMPFNLGYASAQSFFFSFQLLQHTHLCFCSCTKQLPALGSTEWHSLHLQHLETRWRNASIPRGTLSGRSVLSTCKIPNQLVYLHGWSLHIPSPSPNLLTGCATTQQYIPTVKLWAVWAWFPGSSGEKVTHFSHPVKELTCITFLNQMWCISSTHVQGQQSLVLLAMRNHNHTCFLLLALPPFVCYSGCCLFGFHFSDSHSVS